MIATGVLVDFGGSTELAPHDNRHIFIESSFDQIVDQSLAIFFYLPFEHSENPTDQELSVSLFTQHFELTNDQQVMNYALEHRDIIARFGRFPHRNAALGRTSTPEELEFLASGGFAG